MDTVKNKVKTVDEYIALYPFTQTNTELDMELKEYKSGKATIQFKLNKPLPTKLITKLVKFRVNESLKKQK